MPSNKQKSTKNMKVKDVHIDTHSQSLGQKVSDKVAATVGSWKFIILQSILIIFWIGTNTAGILKFDPFPFIFLNLALSFQAAYTAPIIMMSQNAQEKRDRANAQEDYRINILAEREIEVILTHLTSIQEKIIKHQEIADNLEQVRLEMKEIKSQLSNFK